MMERSFVTARSSALVVAGGVRHSLRKSFAVLRSPRQLAALLITAVAFTGCSDTSSPNTDTATRLALQR